MKLYFLINGGYFIAQLTVYEGEVLKEGDNRSKVFLATKFGNEFDPETRKGTGKVKGIN